MQTPPPSPRASSSISGTYVQSSTCPSTISVNVFNVNSTTFMPGVSYYGNAVLSVDVPPLRSATVSCNLVMTYTVGSTTNSVVFSTLSVPWPIGSPTMNLPFTFLMKDLGLPTNSTVSVKVGIDCVINCT